MARVAGVDIPNEKNVISAIKLNRSEIKVNESSIKVRYK